MRRDRNGKKNDKSKRDRDKNSTPKIILFGPTT